MTNLDPEDRPVPGADAGTGIDVDVENVEPGPEIAALRDHFEAEGFEVAGINGDHLLLWIGVDSLWDAGGDEIELDEPLIIGLHFGAPDEGNYSWIVTLETPAILALGDLGQLLDQLPSGDDHGWRLHSEEGSAVLEICDTVEMTPADGFDVGGEFHDLFVQIASEFAPTGLRFAGRQQEMDGVRTPGYWELHCGQTAFDEHRFAEAEEHYGAAHEHFVAAGLEDGRIGAQVGRAVTMVFSGRTDEAQRILEQNAQELPPADQCREEQAFLRGHVVGMLGMIHILQGRYDESVEAFREASALADVDGMEWMMNYVMLRSPDEASRIAKHLESPQHMASIKGDLNAQAETGMLLSMHYRRIGDFQKAAEWLSDADDALRANGDDAGRSGALAELAMLRLSLKDLDGARAALQSMRALPPPTTLPLPLYQRMLQTVSDAVERMVDGRIPAATELESVPLDDTAVFGAAASLLSGIFSMPADAGLDEQLAAIAKFCDVARSLCDDAALAVSLGAMAEHRLTYAVRNLRLDLPKQANLALDECLEAIRLHDRTRHRLDDIADRSRYMVEILKAYEFALLIACDLRNDAALAAELLLRIKAVGLPDHDGSMLSGLFPVTEPTHVSVGGRSRLAPDGAATIGLERDRIDRQAGEGSWWFSLWQGRDFVFWATASPSGSIDAGAVALDPQRMAGAMDAFGPILSSAINKRFFDHGALGLPLDRLRADLPIGGADPANSPARGIDGILGTDHRSEAELMLAVGEVLIPDKLKRAIRAADRENPIRLLYEPSPSLSWLPLSLLAIESAPGHQEIRLVERAIVQVAPPLLDTPLMDSSPSAGGVLAIIDPENDLEVLHPLAARATAVLAGKRLSDKLDERSLGDATLGRVLMALADGGRYRTLLYAGHARSATGDSPLSGGLRLGIDGKEALTVGDIVEHAAKLDCPKWVILCGCSTGTDRSPTETERWGLASALLLCGARSIVVTGWDLLACPATTRIVDQLLQEMAANDPTTALRTVQLDALDRWRRAIAAGNTAYDDESAEAAHPYLWAPFSVMGRD